MQSEIVSYLNFGRVALAKFSEACLLSVDSHNGEQAGFFLLSLKCQERGRIYSGLARYFGRGRCARDSDAALAHT